MRAKELKGIAQNLAAMACSEARLGHDFERLAALSDGEVTIDLIHCTAFHSAGQAVSLSIVQSLTSWLSNSGAGGLSSAKVSLHIETGRPPTHRETLISFNLKGDSVLEAQGRTYVGEASNHVWYNRI